MKSKKKKVHMYIFEYQALVIFLVFVYIYTRYLYLFDGKTFFHLKIIKIVILRKKIKYLLPFLALWMWNYTMQRYYSCEY